VVFMVGVGERKERKLNTLLALKKKKEKTVIPYGRARFLKTNAKGKDNNGKFSNLHATSGKNGGQERKLIRNTVLKKP